VSGKNNKILPIPETMQGISTSAESKEERSKKKKKKVTTTNLSVSANAVFIVHIQSTKFFQESMYLSKF
jgi:hypothetical protein